MGMQGIAMMTQIIFTALLFYGAIALVVFLLICGVMASFT